MGFFLTLILFAGMQVLADLMRPDLEQAQPATLGDFSFPTATEGRVLPLIWGTVKLKGPNVIWYGDLLQEAITERVKVSLLSHETILKGYRYHLGLQLAWCQGSDDLTMRRLYIGDDEVEDFTGAPIGGGDTFTVDKPDLFGGEDLGQGGVVGTLQFFSGSNTQTASGYLENVRVTAASITAPGTGYSVGDILTEAGDGTASTRSTYYVSEIAGGQVTKISRVSPGSYSTTSTNPAATTVVPGGGSGCTLTLTYSDPLQTEGGDTPGYRDVAYLLPHLEHVQLGTSTSIKPWAAELRRIPDGLALGGGDELIDGGANLANVLYEVLTDDDWGYGYGASDINVANFTTAAGTLATEGNGFSFTLDGVENLEDMIRRLEEQMDGVLYQNPMTGKWEIKLARADYDVLLVPEINATNIIELRDFNRGTWEGTTNQIRVPFNDASDDYKSSYGFAQDMANVRILGMNVSASVGHPGVKTASLANSLAWRELRTLAIPLANASFTVDRSFYGVLPGEVVAFTDADLGFNRLPMRVKSIDYGDLLDGKIKIEAIQDVFFAAAGVFSDNPSTGWEPPAATLVAYPDDEQIAIEAPRALTARDPQSVSPTTDKVYAFARRAGSEVTFQIWQRNHATLPAGAYSEIGEVFGFSKIGRLALALPLGATNPVTSVTVTAAPDTQAALLAAFPTVLDAVELGTDLISLCMIDDEFVLVTSAQSSGSDVQLNTVYRGVLDSVQADHAVGASVFLVFSGAGMGDSALPAGNVVDVKLLPRAAGALLAIGDATNIQLTLSSRTRRPYPPSEFDLNSVTLPTTNVDLDGTGTGEDVGVLIDSIIRRDFRTVDEIEALGTDAAAIFSDFPAANSTTVEIEVRNGVTVLHTETGISGTTTTARQLDILEALDTTALPSSLVFAVRESHTFEFTVYGSRDWLAVTSTILSEFLGTHPFGTLDNGDESGAYTVLLADNGTDHDFTLSTAFTVGDVEVKVNAGAWTTLITAGGTTGTVTAPATNDQIFIRHNSTDTNPQKLLVMDVAGTVRGYAVLIS